MKKSDQIFTQLQPWWLCSDGRKTTGR